MTISDKELEDIGFIENPREIIVEYNQEQWQAELVEKYQKLYNVVQETLPNLWDSLEFEISVQKVLNIKDCTLPFAGIVLGRPSSMKTVGIGMCRTWKNSFYSDKFTAKAFVSHSTAVKNKKELENIDIAKINRDLNSELRFNLCGKYNVKKSKQTSISDFVN